MIDLMIIVWMILFIAVGYRKGLIRTLITFSSSIIALILTFIVYPVVKEIILKVTTLYTLIYTNVFEHIQGIDFGRGLQTQAKSIVENITWLPKVLTEQIASNNNTAMYEYLGVTSIQEYISAFITNTIIALVAILVTWLIIKIALGIGLELISGIIEHLPVISSCNHLGGGILGGLKGLLTVSIVVLVIPMIMMNPSFGELGSLVESSYLAQWIYKYNPIIWIYNYLI